MGVRDEERLPFFHIAKSEAGVASRAKVAHLVAT
jgi:hypothetical protein